MVELRYDKNGNFWHGWYMWESYPWFDLGVVAINFFDVAMYADPPYKKVAKIYFWKWQLSVYYSFVEKK